MYDIFLSYSTQDRGRLQPLFTALEQQGWSVFWDHESIHTGENWSLKIETAINNSRCVVVVWSKHSIHSEWVREEATVGKRRNVLLPLLLDGVEPPVGFLLRQADDFNRWNGKPSHPAFVRLAAQVYAKLNSMEPPPVLLSPKPRWPLYAGVAAVMVAAAGSYQLLPLDRGVEERQSAVLAEEPTSKPQPVMTTPVAPAPAPEPDKTYRLTLNITPANATVRVDGKPYTAGQQWEAGEHALHLAAKGYLSDARIIRVEGDTQLDFALTREPLPYGLELLDIIPAGQTGRFIMGCDPQRDNVEGGCQEDEKPIHPVTLKPFRLAKTEVTVAQFRAFIEATSYKTTAEEQGSCWSLDDKGSWGDVKGNFWKKLGFEQGDNHPVACVSWDDTQAYLKWLNETVQPEQPFRLPTEAEWEYAARGDTAHGDQAEAYPWGKKGSDGCAYANMADQEVKKKFTNATVAECNDGYLYTAPVGKFKANGYGLQDMHGNVWEWMQDWYGSDYYGTSSASSSPEGPASGTHRVLRGGSWYGTPRDVRSADRGYNTPFNRYNNVGFRFAQDQ